MASRPSSYGTRSPSLPFSFGGFSDIDPDRLPPFNTDSFRLCLVATKLSDLAPLAITPEAKPNGINDPSPQGHLKDLEAPNSERESKLSVELSFTTEKQSKHDLPVLIAQKPGTQSTAYIRASILQNNVSIEFPFAYRDPDGRTRIQARTISIIEFGPSFFLRDPNNLNSAVKLPDAESRTFLMNLSSRRVNLKAYGIIFGREGTDLSKPLIDSDITKDGHLLEFRFFTRRPSYPSIAMTPAKPVVPDNPDVAELD